MQAEELNKLRQLLSSVGHVPNIPLNHNAVKSTEQRSWAVPMDRSSFAEESSSSSSWSIFTFLFGSPLFPPSSNSESNTKNSLRDAVLHV